MEIDRISASFKDQVVLMTGATGFMGKVFLERVLRLTEVRQVFLLIRPKRSKNSEERLLEIFDNPLFETLKARMSLATILAKVSVVAGDCSCVDLSLAPSDRSSLVANTTMMFHFAATIKFNEKFKRAIELNVRGTREMLKLALECAPRLLLFCHISTAFCHLEQRHLLEQAYEPAADPHAMIAIAETFDEDKVEALLSRFLSKNIPNSYVFTKALSETLVEKFQQEHALPAMIARPAIIMTMYKDPIPGWTDNLYNICGATSAAGLGILRTFLVTKGAQLNITSVDYTIANVMAGTWHYLQEKPTSLSVINLEYLSADLVKEFKKSIKASRKTPFDFFLWYPNVLFTNCPFFFYVNMILFQLLPSLFVDTLLMMFGRKPVLVSAQRKMHTELSIVKTFHDNKWVFDQTNIKNIYALMNKREKREFGTEERDPRHFSKHQSLGVRKFVFKQKDEDLAKAQTRMKIIYVIDRFVKAAFFWWLLQKLRTIFNDAVVNFGDWEF